MSPAGELGGSPACSAHELLDYTSLNVEKIRLDFPILDQEVNGKKLVYLDNAASTQKPLTVIDAIRDYYLHDHANVHRGVHALSQRATEVFEGARRKIQRFMNAPREHEIILTKGCTEAINLVAATWGRANLGPGDQVLITAMEHHADIVPWQMVCQQTGAQLLVAPITDDGELIMEEFLRLLTERVKLVGVVHVSNSLGTVNPVAKIVRMAKAVGALVLVDGAQAGPHLGIDVQALGADFYTLSGHKVYGPTGIGALYGREELLEAMPPYQFGGDMIRTVSFEETTFAGLPNKFEPGTPNISGTVGLGAALDYVQSVGLGEIAEHERKLTRYAHDLLSEIPGLNLIGRARDKAGIVAFTLQGAHPHDIGTVLDMEGIAIRAGHHCCMPLMTRLKIPATARASFAMYNTTEEVEKLAVAVRKVSAMFA